MAEEFEESEVIFAEITTNHVEDQDYHYYKQHINSTWESRNKKIMKPTSSAPVNIPENIVSRNSWLRCMESDDEGGEMVPPHVMVGRRLAGKMMALSVCTGNGRTLKGRDLSQVRNSILRMTGFLET